MLNEAEAARIRFELRHDRTVRDMGLGSTETVLKLSEDLLPRMIEAIETEKKVSKGSLFLAKFFKAVDGIDTSVLALCAIQVAFNAVGYERNNHVMKVARAIGNAIDSELFGRFMDDIPGCSKCAIEKRVARKRGGYRQRRIAVMAAAKRKGLVRPRHLKPAEMVQAGGWLLGLLLKVLPETFTTFEYRVKADRSPERFLTITDEAVARCDKIAAECIRRHPMYFPSYEEPAPWSSFYHATGVRGVSKALVRTYHNETRAAVRAAIESGKMQPALDAINRVQSVAFTINKGLLEVMEACLERGVSVESLPKPQPIQKPEKPKAWEDMTHNERLAWRRKAAAATEANRSRNGQLVELALDMETARVLVEKPAFWTLQSFDWRGRMYSVPRFNFQREDRVRALFLFRDGRPIGERGLWWLKVHVANCGDYNKVSKRSFEERMTWVDRNLERIVDMVRSPLHLCHMWWTDADKPFLFLAACMELVDAIIGGPEFVTHLPVSWDGSCSGLQHLSAMARADEGILVNLTPCETPRDVYQSVADEVVEALSLSLNPLAKLCLANGVNRKLVKRNVMTFPYSATKFGMGQQHVEDTMEPLTLKVLSGELAEHPYGKDNGLQASVFIAKHVHAAIKKVVRKPAEVMGFLQALARALAHEGKPVEWTTPAGLPWSNRYHPLTVKTVKLWLYDKGVRIPYRASVSEDKLKDIDKRRVESAVAPNFVHACDASHLMLTVNAAYDAGIRNFAMVHDSFGCLAPQSDDMHRIIREEFVSMYEHHDVLDEVLQQSFCALTSHNRDRLPDVIDRGSLNIRSVLDARYAFA